MNEDFGNRLRQFAMDNGPCVVFGAAISGRQDDGCPLPSYACFDGGCENVPPVDILYLAAAAMLGYEYFLQGYVDKCGKTTHEAKALIADLIAKAKTRSLGDGAT